MSFTDTLLYSVVSVQFCFIRLRNQSLNIQNCTLNIEYSMVCISYRQSRHSRLILLTWPYPLRTKVSNHEIVHSVLQRADLPPASTHLPIISTVIKHLRTYQGIHTGNWDETAFHNNFLGKCKTHSSWKS